MNPDISHHYGEGFPLENTKDGVVAQLRDLKEHHHWDPNLPDEVVDEVKEALETTDEGVRTELAHELLDNSPYPEVRSAVSNIDEGGDGNTIRAWALGLIFATIGPGLNVLFSMRAPSISVSTIVAQITVYPIGKALARWVPSKEFRIFGLNCNLNPGPFSRKEHVMIILMANACFGTAYATDVLLAQKVFYGQHWGWGFELLMCLSTQLLGFGFSGIFHNSLVEPAAMIWPGNLASTALFNTLHEESRPDPANTNNWKISRYSLFLRVMLGSFIWYWFPGYIAPFLSMFVWPTWIKPESVIVNQLFGGQTGLGLLPSVPFDWSQVAGYLGTPLMSPWFAIANTLICVVFWFWIVTPAIHYTGLFYSEYLPISDSGSYDNTGKRYNVTRILTPDFKLDPEKYRSYSPLFLSTSFMLSYGLSFASIISLLVHTGLFHGMDVWRRFRRAREEEEDVHSRLMSRYKPVPLWWYLSVTLVMLGVSLGVILGYPTELTWWAFFISIIISLVWWYPIGLLTATTNIGIGLNVITEFIIGYMQPGKPMAMMLFKTYGYITMNQGLSFNSDMKLGHYMKIPPRVTFAAQMIGAFWGSIVQIAAMNWTLGSVKDVCTPHQENYFTCPGGRVFFTASVIWGLIGPKRIFSIGQLYSPLMYFWIVGLLLPVVVYLAARKFPKSPIRYFNAPLFFGATGNIPPATALNYVSWCFVGFIFNRYIRNRFRGWWMTYNYIMSAGLDIGLALATILIFLSLNLTKTEFPDWWGKTIASSTLDMQGTAVQKRVAKGEKFGPHSW